METLLISLAEVTEAAASIRSQNGLCTELLNEIRNKMQSVSAFWQSDGQNAIQERFQSFSIKFEQYQEIIESYARFLDQTVSSYDALESTIQNNANAVSQ